MGNVIITQTFTMARWQIVVKKSEATNKPKTKTTTKQKTKTKQNKQTNKQTTNRLIRDGEKLAGGGGGGAGSMEVGEEGERLYTYRYSLNNIYLSLHCHHQNDFCIKVGSDESHFNVSLIVRNKVTSKTVFADRNFEEKGEPKRIRNEVPLLTSLTPYR